jgi:type IV pilus assembly protein PilX
MNPGMSIMNTIQRPRIRSARRVQRGTALVTSLLLLLVLTIIGVTAMQMTRMQERMAGNTRDLNMAFQGAEAALRNGEDMIFAQPFPPDTCTAAPCEYWAANASAVSNPETRDWTTWWVPNTDQYEANGNHAAPTRELTDLAADPQFVVEYVTDVPDTLTKGDGSLPTARYFYQVTAMSPGATLNAKTVLQSTYARR